jgi:tellurite resistance protein TehA-like permease
VCNPDNQGRPTVIDTYSIPVLVPPITVAAVGNTLCKYLILEARYDYALTIMIASYVMCGVGLLVACGLMVIYFQRLAIHRLPPREVIVSTFLPLGPCGQGGYSLVELVSNMAHFACATCARAHPAFSCLARVVALSTCSLYSHKRTRTVQVFRSWLNWVTPCWGLV